MEKCIQNKKEKKRKRVNELKTQDHENAKNQEDTK